MRDDDEQPTQRTCVDCGAHAPATDTNYTLISSRYGWRLTRRMERGQFVVEWRCPRCWDRYKRAKSTMTPLDGIPHVGPRRPSIDDDEPPPSAPPLSPKKR